jgi:hypothetical protein
MFYFMPKRSAAERGLREDSEKAVTAHLHKEPMT